MSLQGEAADLLRRETAGHHLIQDETPDWSNIDVAFGQPDPQAVIQAEHLKWTHISSAGYTRYDTDEFRNALHRRGGQFTNSSHVYDEPCAQHLLAMMLAFSRQLLPCYEEQLQTQDWKTSRRRADSFLLNRQTVLMLGFGAIAQRLTQLLQPFDMRIIAMRRNVQPFEGVQVISEDAVEKYLGQAQHVVNILPDNPSTHGWMNVTRFALLQPGAFFYNIGRGTTVDQNALIKVLLSGHLGAAYLDVTDPEPLPRDHPLWTTPNCFITPHSGGGHHGETVRLVQHFVENLRRFEQGEALRNRVF
jgi:phosphoglycerate dehydrogenase-like enzyme